jgi:uncharacterized protein YndB with AHSA1/START domain
VPTRAHVVEIDLPAPPERVFAALVTPSAIRAWWRAARVIVLPEPGGTWAAAWGADEDAPDYVSVATLTACEPPRRLAFGDYRYAARSGPLPFAADLTTEFTLAPAPGGTRLEVVQDGFPADPVADDFYAACERGWSETLESLRRFLAEG